MYSNRFAIMRSEVLIGSVAKPMDERALGYGFELKFLIIIII